MNGRIFDPVLGRFLSADPNIDGVSDSQGYNRYSYVHNNPLNATDPSGYLSLREVLPAIVAVVVTAVALVATAGSGAGATAGFWAQLGHALGNASAMQMAGAAAAGGFCSGFSGSLLNGGSIGDAFKAGVIGGVTGAVTGYISNVIGGVFGHNPAEFDLLRELGRAASHGLVGGAVSEAQGGEFRHGFYSSFASSAFSHSPVSNRLVSSSNIALSTATTAVVGGTVSVLAGGKFANGATTAAFQNLFNKLAIWGDAKYKASVEIALERIRKADPALAGMVTQLEESDREHVIRPRYWRDDGNLNVPSDEDYLTKWFAGMERSGSETKWNPTDWDGWDRRDPVIGLVHELSHALDRNNGVSQEFLDTKVDGWKDNSEFRACRMENIMRRALGAKERTGYYTD